MNHELLILFATAFFMGCSRAPSGTSITYPEACYLHNGQGGAVIDITKPPYNADNTGREDCTGILIRAMDDVLGADRKLMKRSVEILESDSATVCRATEMDFSARQKLLERNPEAVVGFERCRGTFPYKNPPSRILYFPNGTYLVSNTITYSYDDLQNRPGKELNRGIHFQGQSEKESIIRLAERAPGYGEGERKPVVSFTSGNMSNVSMQNTFENLTIEIGEGNPGAVGLEFFCNNTGAVRHVTVRSTDTEKRGRSGVAIYTWNSSCAFLQHISVVGCDYGVEIREPRLYSVVEHLFLQDQRKAGLHVNRHNVAVRGITSDNRVPAVELVGKEATLALVDCRLDGGSGETAAIRSGEGFLMARNIETNGYGMALVSDNGDTVRDRSIREYVSHVTPLLPGHAQRSLDLPVLETPKVPWYTDPGSWVSVNAHGAAGDGLTDDTEAIQAAMDAGREVVYFQPGTYLISRTIQIPAHVRRINFMYCDLVSGEPLHSSEGAGAFRVTGNSGDPLIIEDLFAFERYFGAHYLVDHAGTRTVILSDLHTQVGAQYINSVPGGKVFIENVCSTDQFEPRRNCFSFKGQQVWARQLNPERADPEVLNEGGRLWVLGFKTEKSGTAYMTTDGGATEILGGIFNISRSAHSSPAVGCRDSRVSVFASTTDHRVRPEEWNTRPVIEIVNSGDTGHLDWNRFPRRDQHLIVVPLFSNLPAGDQPQTIDNQ